MRIFETEDPNHFWVECDGRGKALVPGYPYIPPSAELSIASCGFSLPSAARGVACRLSAWTSLRPVTMLRFFA